MTETYKFPGVHMQNNLKKKNKFLNDISSCSFFFSCAAIEICNESIPGLKVEFIDIEPLPFVNTDLEKDGTYPPVVEAFRQKILEADCILFASPEYNYSVPGNAICFPLI